MLDDNDKLCEEHAELEIQVKGLKSIKKERDAMRIELEKAKNDLENAVNAKTKLEDDCDRLKYVLLCCELMA